jgi:hypothetical protein
LIAAVSAGRARAPAGRKSGHRLTKEHRAGA